MDNETIVMGYPRLLALSTDRFQSICTTILQKDVQPPGHGPQDPTDLVSAVH